MGPFSPGVRRIPIGETSFLTEPPWEFVDDEGRVGEGPIVGKYWHVKPGDVVVDVGACYGLYTLPSCALGAFVYAVEPNESSCATIERMLALNGFADRCTIVHAALSHHEGDHPVELRACTSPFFEGVPAVTTLDNMVEKFGIDRLDWIKVDVEGGELCVVEGGVATLKRLRPVVVIEDHTDVEPFASYCRAHRTNARIKEILGDLGYTIEEEPHSGRNFIVGHPQPSRQL